MVTEPAVSILGCCFPSVHPFCNWLNSMGLDAQQLEVKYKNYC